MKYTECKEAVESDGEASASWRRELQRQASQAMLREATRLAAVELARLAELGIDGGHDAGDLVQTILAATCAGELTWNPAAVSLLCHVVDGVRLACRRSLRRGRMTHATQGIPLNALAEGDPRWADIEDALEASAAEPAGTIRDLARQLEIGLRQLAAGDATALRVLDALPSGATVDELAEATDLDAPTVRSALGRLQRLARRLPRTLQAEIHRAMPRNAPWFPADNGNVQQAPQEVHRRSRPIAAATRLGKRRLAARGAS